MKTIVVIGLALASWVGFAGGAFSADAPPPPDGVGKLPVGWTFLPQGGFPLAIMFEWQTQDFGDRTFLASKSAPTNLMLCNRDGLSEAVGTFDYTTSASGEVLKGSLIGQDCELILGATSLVVHRAWKGTVVFGDVKWPRRAPIARRGRSRVFAGPGGILLVAPTDAFLAPPPLRAASHDRQCPVPDPTRTGNFDPCRTLGKSACRHLSTASVAGDLLRISRAIQTAPRAAARTRRACGIRTQ